MADLDQLKQKYAGVISTIESFQDLGATVDQVDLDGEKLHLKATVPSTVVLNRVWAAIKEVDPTWSDLHHEIGTAAGVNSEQPYTIKSGDNLSHIAKRFYGESSKYSEIASANGMDKPDLIRVGQEIKLPVIED